MNRTAQEVQTCWLESRQPEDRTGNEAEKFSDECWKNGLRLDKSRKRQRSTVLTLIYW
ncbi:TPA: hypothetical protein ACPUMB_004934 [Klebsiella pneumoniae]